MSGNTNYSPLDRSVHARQTSSQLSGLPGRLPSGILLNVVAPFLVYRVLTGQGASELVALLAAGAVPTFDLAATRLREGRVSWISVAALATVAFGLVASLASNNPFFLLIRDSFIFALLGLICWGSLLLPRPVLFVLGRNLATRRQPSAEDRYDQRWGDSAFRRRLRVTTFVWGLGFLGLAVLRTIVATLVPVSWFLLLGPSLSLLIIGALALWTWHGAKES